MASDTASPRVRIVLSVLCLAAVAAFIIFLSRQEPQRPVTPRMKEMQARIKAENPAASAENPAPPQPDPSGADKARTRELITFLLGEDLDTRRFSFADVVAATSGQPVHPVAPEHQPIIDFLTIQINTAVAQLNAPDSPTNGLRRINEASRFFEDALLYLISADPDYDCGFPLTASGSGQRSGYPDLLITHLPSQSHFYLDPKLVESGSLDSSLRTFYYTPRRKTSKVTLPAVHLLLGIEHDGNDGAWKYLSWRLVDLSTLSVRLKPEFQANNKDLYENSKILGGATEPKSSGE